MAAHLVPGLQVDRAESDAGLEAIIAVRTAADPDRPPPRIENLRHNLAPMRTLNENLGYRPAPALSEVVIQGPAAS
jgi:hypothetical protein